MLRQARVPVPIILVGEGDAASHIRVYHGNYPNDVAGVVMLDANDIDVPKLDVPDAEKGGFQRLFGSWPARVRGAACWARPFMDRVGVIRFATLFSKPRGTNSFGLTTEQQVKLDDLPDDATTQQATEACACEESMGQVRAAGDLCTVPLVVVVSKAGEQASASQGKTEAAWIRNRIETVPNALAALSTRSRAVRVDNDLQTDAIVQAVLDVLRPSQGSR